MLTLLLGRDWTANRDAVLRRLAADVKNRQGGRILMVPELVSHEAERALCAWAGDTASRYAEVLSFTRLARRVSDQMGSAAMECLDKGGRVVAMAAAARQLSSKLKAYAAVETKPEFLAELIDGIDEFKRCCISPGDLLLASRSTEGSLAQKLEELSLLMETYDSLCSRGKRDPRDQMTWLLEQLEQGDYGENHVFYIDGFPDFTRQNLAILEHLIRVSPSVTVSLNCDAIHSHLLAFEKAGSTAAQIFNLARRAGIPVEIEKVEPAPSPFVPLRSSLFQGSIREGSLRGLVHPVRAESPWQACMDAARRVQTLVRNGCRYRDISLVCADMPGYQDPIRMVFGRMGIPVYQSGTESVLRQSMMATVLTALDAALTGFERSRVLDYLRSAQSPVDQDTCDLLDNYAAIWSVRGNRWKEPWVNHPDGLSGIWDDEAYARLALLNQAREQAIAPLERLHQAFSRATALHQQVTALYAFLQEIGLEERLRSLAQAQDASGDNRSAQILGQLWEILISALEQLYDVLGQTHWDAEHFVRLLKLLLSQYEVGTIPPVLDAVQLGPVNAMRCHSQRHLFVLGAEEGKLPGYSGSSGVLTDQERVALRALGVPLTGGAMDGIQEEFSEIYGVFCGACESVVVYSADVQPSYLFHRLVQMAGETQMADPGAGFACADPFEAGAWLAKDNYEDAAVRLGVEQQYQEVGRRRDYDMGAVSQAHVRSLYGASLNLSASQVDSMAECRLSYFLKYGLRAKERKEATVDPAEFGTYVHAVLENTVRSIREMGGFHKVSLEETMTIAHRFSDAYADDRFSMIDSERFRHLFRRNLRELDMVVEELWQELKDSGFAPRDVEVKFGDDGLPAIPIPNSRIPAILRGFVDRVDVWQSPGSPYYRVVDYKTGKKEFDYCDVFNGVGLQMLLYLFALEHSGGDLLPVGAIPAGVQYFPARAPYLPADGEVDAETASRLRESEWRRRGLLLEDEAVLRAMGEDSRKMGYAVKKDGSLSGDLADREQMKLLKGYVFRVLSRLVEEIAAGNVTPNPYTRGSSHDACRFCPYGSVCHSDSVLGRRNYATMSSQRFWEEVGKEMDSHG